MGQRDPDPGERITLLTPTTRTVCDGGVTGRRAPEQAQQLLMPLYRVKLRGENFLLNLTGEPELLGFHVTHYVEASTEAEAGRIATIVTRQNRMLHDRLLNNPQNPSKLECEAAKRVWWRRSRHNGRYQFWSMEAAEDST